MIDRPVRTTGVRVCWYEEVPPTLRSHWSLARQLLVLQLTVLCVLAGAGITFAWLDARRAVGENARDQVAAVALTVADAPSVVAAVTTPDPSATLQPFAQRVKEHPHVDFITIMSPAGSATRTRIPP